MNALKFLLLTLLLLFTLILVGCQQQANGKVAFHYTPSGIYVPHYTNVGGD